MSTGNLSHRTAPKAFLPVRHLRLEPPAPAGPASGAQLLLGQTQGHGARDALSIRRGDVDLMLTVIFAPWSRPACQPGLSRHRLEFFHGRVSPRSRVTGDLASAPVSSSSHYHIHGWTLSRICGLPAPDLPAGPATAAMLEVLDFSPRLLQKLWNCSYRLGSCPFPTRLPTAACLPSTLKAHRPPSNPTRTPAP